MSQNCPEIVPKLSQKCHTCHIICPRWGQVLGDGISKKNMTNRDNFLEFAKREKTNGSSVRHLELEGFLFM